MANPRTIRLAGSGTDTQQYELAPGLAQYVQSVRVVVDNTAGGNASPTLSISEQSGVVIADVPQNGVLPAGEADGAATWALRLTDDAAAQSSSATFGFYGSGFGGDSVPASNSADLTFVALGGAALLDLTVPTLPVVLAAGTYAFTAAFSLSRSGVFTNGVKTDFQLSWPATFFAPLGIDAQLVWSGIGPAQNVTGLAATVELAAGDTLRMQVNNSQTAGGTVVWQVGIGKLG